jgi:hypothetical protein
LYHGEKCTLPCLLDEFRVRMSSLADSGAALAAPWKQVT